MRANWGMPLTSALLRPVVHTPSTMGGLGRVNRVSLRCCRFSSTGPLWSNPGLKLARYQLNPPSTLPGFTKLSVMISTSSGVHSVLLYDHQLKNHRK